MGLIIDTSGFKGVHHISQNQYSITDLDEYIDRFEKPFLENLLGCELADLLISDLNPSKIPVTARFIDIFNKFCEDDVSLLWYWNSFWETYFISDPYWISSGQVQSAGIPDMLKGLIYFEFVRNQNNNNTIVGTVENAFSNSKHSPMPDTNVFRNHNSAISTYKAIQWFICQNSDVYPEFKGVRKNYTSWL